MRDPRLDKLARVLVHYATRIEAGQLVRLTGDPVAMPLLEAIYEELVRSGAHVLPQIVRTVIGMMPELFQATKDLFGDMVRGIGAMLADIGRAVMDIGADIVDRVLGFGGRLFDAGKNIIQSMIDGIKSMFGKIGDVMGDVGGRVRNFLPFSPAKEGPLSGSGSPDRAGAKISDMVADGILAGEGDVAVAMRRITRMDVDVTAAMGRGLTMDPRAAGPGIFVTVEGAIDPEGTARTILRTLRDAERRTGDRLRV